MRNYAEELVYWFLRLQGFFPITDWVSKREERNDQNTLCDTDTDILAVRLPHVKEKIGDYRKLRDGYQEDGIDINPVNSQLRGAIPWIDDEKYVGIIGEVKAGSNAAIYTNETKVCEAIERLGIIEVTDQIREQWKNNTILHGNNVHIYKVKFANINRTTTDWHKISLLSVNEYIKHHLRQWGNKKAQWSYYPSNLLQYMLKAKQD